MYFFFLFFFSSLSFVVSSHDRIIFQIPVPHETPAIPQPDNEHPLSLLSRGNMDYGSPGPASLCRLLVGVCWQAASCTLQHGDRGRCTLPGGLHCGQHRCRVLGGSAVCPNSGGYVVQQEEHGLPGWHSPRTRTGYQEDGQRSFQSAALLYFPVRARGEGSRRLCFEVLPCFRG